MTGDSDNYSLAGAEYTVYETNNDGKLSSPVGTLTTDENGDTYTLKLLQKTYYVQETKAPKGYALDDTIHTVTITGTHTLSNPCLLQVEDTPQLGSLRIMKRVRTA